MQQIAPCSPSREIDNALMRGGLSHVVFGTKPAFLFNSDEIKKFKSLKETSLKPDFTLVEWTIKKIPTPIIERIVKETPDAWSDEQRETVRQRLQTLDASLPQSAFLRQV